MSAAATQAPVRGATNTRRVPRFPLAVPADITVLRSGVPYSIPGRSVTLGERGVGVVLAGELRPGDSVGVEFRLPDAGGRFRLKAVVRYQALLHCGLEFVNLTSEQQTLIEHWTGKRSGGKPIASSAIAGTQSSAPPVTTTTPPLVSAPDRKTHRVRFRRTLGFVVAGLLLVVGSAGWHWHQAWGELESQIPASKPVLQQPPAYVSAEVMERLVTHKIEPVYPEAARQANIQGVVILDALIGPDGTVVDLRPISGPDELTTAAVDAVKWWRFQPYRVNGQAVEVETRLAVDFRGN